jgi:hypothetical protein
MLTYPDSYSLKSRMFVKLPFMEEYDRYEVMQVEQSAINVFRTR